MENLSKVLSTNVIPIDDGSGVSLLQILIALLALVIGFFVAVWVERRISCRLERSKIDPGVIQVLRKLFYTFVVVLLVIFTLNLIGIPLTAFAFITGAVAIGIGFGAQNIINNFISGWILMGERPIRIGDFLEIDDMLGTVEAIKTRFTRVRRIDGVRLLIPNSHFLENTVVNWTVIDRTLRSSVRVGVRYGTDVQKVEHLLVEILEDNPDTLDDPAPSIVFEDFGDSALVFDAFFWIELSAGRTLRGLRSALRFEIDRVFKENSIVIAFPQRDIHVDGSLKLENIE